MTSANDMAPSSLGASGGAMAAARGALAHLRARARKGLWIEGLGLLGLLLVAYALPSFLTDRLLRLEWAFRAVLLASFVVVVWRVLHRRVVQPLAVPLSDDEMALAVERRSPQVRQALVSSLSFEERLARGDVGPDSPQMMAAVVDDVRSRLASIPFDAAIEGRRVRQYLLAIFAALVVFSTWIAVDSGSFGLWARRNLLLSNVDWPRYTTLSLVDGVTEIRMPQGDSLTLRVRGAGVVPDQVFLDYRFASGDEGTDPMSRSGDDEFTLTIDRVVEDAELLVYGGDALPVHATIVVVERPRIEDLQLRIEYPSYMERAEETVPATQSDLRLPLGAVLHVAGRSHKAIEDAFLLVGDERRVPMQRGEDGFAFSGSLQPEASGMLTIDVVDRDRLGSGTPPKVLLRVGDDREPKLDFKLRGISSMITTHTRIPGQLLVRDDFGLREVIAEMKVIAEVTGDGGGEAPPPIDVPFEKVVCLFADELERSAVRYETEATVDTAQWNPIDAEDGESNRVRPGMLLSLRFAAKDNFGPGEPHVGYSETMSFRVVTREKLLEELRRRQVEQRLELQRILDEVKAARNELRENAIPATAGALRPAVEARLEVLARQQQSLGRRVALVGETYQRILWEYENNRLIDPSKVRGIENRITVPLAAVAKEAFPASSRLVREFRRVGDEAAKASAVDSYEAIVRTIEAVLKEMEEAESLAAILEELRIVIKMEDSTIQQVEKRVRDAEQDLFGPGKEKK